MRLVGIDAFLLVQDGLQLLEGPCHDGVNVVQVGRVQAVLLTQQPLVEHYAQWDVDLEKVTQSGSVSTTNTHTHTIRQQALVEQYDQQDLNLEKATQSQ